MNKKEKQEFNAEMLLMLEKRDIKELEDFLIKWNYLGVYDNRLVDGFLKSCYEVKMMTLVKMICSCHGTTLETKKWAVKEADKLGCSTQIW